MLKIFNIKTFDLKHYYIFMFIFNIFKTKSIISDFSKMINNPLLGTGICLSGTVQHSINSFYSVLRFRLSGNNLS